MFIGFDYYRVCAIYGFFSLFFMIYSYSPALLGAKVSNSQIKALVTCLVSIFFTSHGFLVVRNRQSVQQMSCEVELNMKHIVMCIAQ